jgi:hypothetical protein
MIFRKSSGKNGQQHQRKNRHKMVSDRLSKVHKAIAKKKGKNPNLHEGSRDTKRLQRASARDDKLNRLSRLREKENRHYCAYESGRLSFPMMLMSVYSK